MMTKLDQAIRSKGRPLIGSAVQSYNPAYVEILGYSGYDVLWIEMEHCPITFAEAADLCRVAAGVGLLAMIRIPDTRRESVLKAAECGPDIIDLPMGNSPAILRELVSHARFAPEGCRGFFGSSRAAGYGMDGDYAALHKRINQELCLISQIETVEAVERAEELCGVPGVNGIFIGPGDLSTSLGLPGQVTHPSVVSAMEQVVEIARASNRIVTMAGGGERIAEWAARGVQVFFLGGEVTSMRQGAQAVIKEALRQIEASERNPTQG
jgi:2-keto-3-deoxy-L-rhamnonate aldolase RhmA